jgi:hypothetical protein
VSDAVAPAERSPWLSGAATVGRWASGILIGGCLAALLFLWILEEGRSGNIFRRHWTQLDFAQGLGTLVSKNSSNPDQVGLFAALVMGVALAVVFVLIERWLPFSSWRKGIPLALLPFLLWGLVFAPRVDARFVRVGDNFFLLKSDYFGTSAGKATPIAAAVASLVACIVLARVVQLMRERWWWASREAEGMMQEHLQEQILSDPLLGADIYDTRKVNPSLELAEEGADQPRIGA